MKKMKKNHNSKQYSIMSRIIENPYFFSFYGILFITACIIILSINKGDEIIFFNQWRNSDIDNFFIFFSLLEENGYFVIFILTLGLFRIKYLIIGISSYIIAGAVVQLIKLFYNMPRPKIYFEGTNLVRFIDNYHINSWYSFPSGHSTSCFAFFLFLAIITKNKKIGIIFLFCAMLVAISRIYLAQHFSNDVFAGSIIGVFFTILVINFFDNNPKINSSNWYNYSIINKLSQYIFKFKLFI